MWWTQPKLALITLAINFGACAVAAVTATDPELRVATLLVAQAGLVAVYWSIARRLGEQHLAGRTAAAFDHNLWNKTWKPSIDRTFLPRGVMPRSDGSSFYRQVLGDGEEARESLYRALSAWEGSRLVWVGSLVEVAIAVASVSIVLTIAPYFGVPLWRSVLGALTLPPWVLLLPEAVNVLLLRRAMLRAGVVDRIAVLTPRDAADLGLRNTEPDEALGWDGTAAMFVAIGVPLLILVTLVAGLRGLLIALALGSIAAVAVPRAWRTYIDFLVGTIPFLRFPGPVSVSVLLDLAHRQRAHLSMAAILWAPMGLVSPFRPLQPPFFYTVFALGYLVAVTFGDQFAGYAGFSGPARFEQCFRRSMAKVEAASS